MFSSLTKLERRRRPASEPEKFLSGVKTIHILQFALHDLKKKFLSAITKLKIGRRQFLLRFLVESNKFCQPIAYGPLTSPTSELAVPIFLTSLSCRSAYARKDDHKPHLHKSIRFIFTCEKSLYILSEWRTALSCVEV